MKTILFTLSLAFLFSSCIKAPDFPNTPEITFVSLNTNTIQQGNSNAQEAILEVVFSFTDGDADIGSDEESNVFLTDSRNGETIPFKVNPIPEQGNGNGIQGEITVRIINTPFNICCVYPNGVSPCTPSTEFPTNTMHYTIQLKDRAGNESNIVQTEDITILCQ